MALGDDVHLSNRLSRASRVSSLPASVQFDLAASDFNDDELDEALFSLGTPEEQQKLQQGPSGWGIGDVFGSLMASEPTKLPVSDLAKQQQFLADNGYVPPGTAADGMWNPEWNSALLRAERDMHEQFMAGAHPLSTTMESAFRFLGGVMPSAVWQGTVGAAKGLIEQAPETAERVGLLGGVASGAAIGAAFGGPLGAGIGAGIGGAVGFFADLFGSDEGEEGQSGVERFWDALTPFEEYTGKDGFYKFAEDLGFVLSAASLIRGGMLAGKGVTSGIGSMGSVAKQEGLKKAMFALGAPAKPGYLARTLASKKGATAVGALGGAAHGISEEKGFGGIATEAFLGGALGYGVGRFGGRTIDNIARNAGLNRQMQMPLLKTINEGFSGLARGQMGARYAGGLGSGDKTTEIEEGIKETKMPGGEVVDFALGWHLFPEKFFALGGAEIANAANKVLGPENLFPYDMLAIEKVPDQVLRNIIPGQQTGEKVLSRGARHERIIGFLSGGTGDKLKAATTDFRLRVSFGLQARAARTIGERNVPRGQVEYLADMQGVQASLKRELLDEWDAYSRGDVADLPLTNDLMSWSKGDGLDADKGPGPFMAWMQDFQGKGTGLERTAQQVQAEEVTETIQKRVEGGELRISYDEMPETPEAGVIYVKGGNKPKKLEPREARLLRVDAAGKVKQAREIRADTTNPNARFEADKLEAEAKELRKQAKAMPRIETRNEVTLVPYNLADETSGLTTTPTAEDAANLADEYDALIQRATTAHAEWLKAPTPEAQKSWGKQLHEAVDALTHNPRDGDAGGLLERLQHQGLLPDDKWTKAVESVKLVRNTGQVKGPGLRVSEHLRKFADVLPHEVVLPDEIAQLLPAGKRLVATGEDMIFYSDIPKALAARNADDFAERPHFWATLRSGAWGSLGRATRESPVAHTLRAFGMNPAMHTNKGIFKARSANQATEVHQVLNLAGVPMTGKQAMNRLYDYQNTINHGEGIRGASETITRGPWVLRKKTTPSGGTKVSRRLYVAEVREMKLDDVHEALDLDKLTPVGMDPSDVAKRVHQALKKGAALGAETDWRHPIQALKMLSKATNVDGMPGFLEFMRTFHIKEPQTFFGGMGAAIGVGSALEEGGDLGDVVKRGAIGAAIGVGATKGLAAGQVRRRGGKVFEGKGVTGKFDDLLKLKFDPGTYGHLPDHLHRFSMATRYTFSLMFDAGRYMEQANIGLMKEDIPMFLRPEKYIKKTFAGHNGMSGEEHWKRALQLHDAMSGGKDMRFIEEIDRRLFQRGILGYSPRYAEAARAYIIKAREPKVGLDELNNRISQLEGYGIGRTTAEKSINFVFFPYSFQKKMLTTLGDFVLQEPGRAFMIHEGQKRFAETDASERMGEFVEKWLPLAQQLQKLNTLAYGIGPGRFFLKGLVDDPDGQQTDLGKAAAILGATFVPSAANNPLAQMFGGAGDAIMHLFSPVVLAEEKGGRSEQGLAEFLSLADSFVPAYRDINDLILGERGMGESTLGAQTLALATGKGDPYWQYQQYLDRKRMIDAELEPTAQALGYASVDGFLQSDMGAAMKPVVDAKKDDLTRELPTGYQMAQNFTNTPALREQALMAMADKDDRSAAEDAILRIAQMEQEGKNMAATLGISQDDVLFYIQPKIRTEAEEFRGDKEFEFMFDKFFAYKYGPVNTILEVA